MEHFDVMLNPGSQCVDLSCIYSLERLPVVSNFGTPPCFEEFIRAINCLKNAKSPGSNSLPLECLNIEAIT